MEEEKKLHYHKCHDCLTAFSSHERKIDECDCGGQVFYMGQVHGDQYVKMEDRSACDGRCTDACGPSCDCKCGGANHGTGKMVQTVVANGKIKVVDLSEQDIQRAEVYRKLRNYAEMLYTTKFAVDTGKDHNLWRLKIQNRRELDRINKLKVYAKRNQDLITFITTNK